MAYDSNDFVTPEHIIAEVTQTVNDPEMKNGLSKGWYISRIQDAMQELAFDTFYQVKTVDMDFPTTRLAIDLPKDFFNVREVYVYNGACCSPQMSSRVYYKRQYNNRGNGSGYTASIKDGPNADYQDPFAPSYYSQSNYWGYPVRKLAFNVENGLMMFSSDCASYQKLRIVYNGMGGEIGEMPIIPREFERAVNDYVEERFYAVMKGREPRIYRSLWNDAYSKLNDFRNGSWEKAKKRIKAMSIVQRESLQEYFTNITHKG